MQLDSGAAGQWFKLGVFVVSISEVCTSLESGHLLCLTMSTADNNSSSAIVDSWQSGARSHLPVQGEFMVFFTLLVTITTQLSAFNDIGASTWTAPSGNLLFAHEVCTSGFGIIFDLFANSYFESVTTIILSMAADNWM
jgi:hypothetical protein